MWLKGNKPFLEPDLVRQRRLSFRVVFAQASRSFRVGLRVTSELDGAALPVSVTQTTETNDLRVFLGHSKWSGTQQSHSAGGGC